MDMQIQAEIPPAQVSAPEPPTPPVGRTIVIEGASGVPAQTIAVPLSLADVRWLRARRAELADQLSDAKDRREAIADEWSGSGSAIRGGLEQQLAQMDQRIIQLESDLAQTERILTSVPTAFLAAPEPPVFRESGSGGDSDAWIAIPVVLILFVLFPLALARTRRMWKGTAAPRASPVEAGRLERIEQAVEAIAVEVERVSEGQRFVTKLLSNADRKPVSLPADR